MKFFGGLFQTVDCVEAERQLIESRSYGVIDVEAQRTIKLHFRPFPKYASVIGAKWDKFKKRKSVRSASDRVRLYYNQPLFYPRYLALSYFVSNAKTSLTSIAISLSVLDYVAKVKQTDAIVTEITNARIRDRHLEHFGWEPHLSKSRRRNWIKRFYGKYPDSYFFQTINDAPQTVEIDSELLVSNA